MNINTKKSYVGYFHHDVTKKYVLNILNNSIEHHIKGKFLYDITETIIHNDKKFTSSKRITEKGNRIENLETVLNRINNATILQIDWKFYLFIDSYELKYADKIYSVPDHINNLYPFSKLNDFNIICGLFNDFEIYVKGRGHRYSNSTFNYIWDKNYKESSEIVFLGKTRQIQRKTSLPNITEYKKQYKLFKKYLKKLELFYLNDSLSFLYETNLRNISIHLKKDIYNLNN